MTKITQPHTHKKKSSLAKINMSRLIPLSERSKYFKHQSVSSLSLSSPPPRLPPPPPPPHPHPPVSERVTQVKKLMEGAVPCKSFLPWVEGGEGCGGSVFGEPCSTDCLF